MDKKYKYSAVKRCIEVTFDCPCNLDCSYCYLPMRNCGGNNSNKILRNHNAEYIGKALSRERLGGSCFINITGGGETLLCEDLPAIARALLEQGHFLAITTNGTLSKRFDQFLKLPQKLLKHLQFTFSLHWLELQRHHLVDVFFDNIDKMRKVGCSFSVRVNICDAYMPHLEDIKAICLERTGVLPHALPTVDFTNQMKLKRHTKLGLEQYNKIGDAFHSVQFNFKNDILFVKQKKFCYAGDWFFYLHLSTGMICPCYEEECTQNIYENIEAPIHFSAIGAHCRSSYCEGCCFILPFGLIPGLKTPTALAMFEREETHSHSVEMRGFMSGKLYRNNPQYSLFKKLKINMPFYKKRLERYKHTSVFKKPKTNLILTALQSANHCAAGNEVVIKKIIIDKKEYAPHELLCEGWKRYEKGYLGWNCFTQGLADTIFGEMPQGHYRAIIFQKNKWRGLVSVEMQNQRHVLDCYDDVTDGEILYMF